MIRGKTPGDGPRITCERCRLKLLRLTLIVNSAARPGTRVSLSVRNLQPCAPTSQTRLSIAFFASTTDGMGVCVCVHACSLCLYECHLKRIRCSMRYPDGIHPRRWPRGAKSRCLSSNPRCLLLIPATAASETEDRPRRVHAEHFAHRASTAPATGLDFC